MSIPKQSAVWDDRRNTSAVHRVNPEALREARRALWGLRGSDPALVRWLEEGYPRLTEHEHTERFGAPWRPTRQRKGDGARG